MKFFTLILSFLLLLCSGYQGHTQINVHSSDFNVSQGESFTTSGNIGTSAWMVTRSGADWGARIHNGILELNNSVSEEANANGWVFAHLATEDFADPFQTTPASNIQKVSWYFNMRQIRPNPAGFTSGAYGVSFILAASSADVQTNGAGYAVVLGNSGTPDPVRLVKFNNGISSLGTATGGLIAAGAPLNDPTNNYMSIAVTFDPATSEWELWGRLDGSEFADPLAGELVLLGSAVDDEYTDVSMAFSGAYWQGSTAASQTAFFDNVSVWVDEGGSFPPVISNVIRDPEGEIDNETTVMVSAVVVPGDAPLETVQLLWGADTDTPEQVIPMSLTSENNWGTDFSIPAQPDNTLVAYRVFAEDEDGLSAMSSISTYTVTADVPDVVIVGVINPQPVTVDFGTAFQDLALPETVIVNLDTGADLSVGVQWQQGDYNPQQQGDYTLEGILQLEDGILNPGNLQPEIMVTVLEEIFSPVVILAGWTFPEEGSMTADLGVADNIGKPISREDGFTGSYAFPTGVSSLSFSSTLWDQGQDMKYYVVEFSTIGFDELTISSVQRSSNAGPRDFKLQYSIVSGEWHDVPDASILVANNFTSGVLNELPLPEEMAQKASVALRWIMTTNTAVNGSDVANSGTSRIDDIIIRGEDSEFVPNVVSVQPLAALTVEQGTEFADLPLPDSVNVNLNTGLAILVAVNWLEGDYDGEITGNYQLQGDLLLPDGVTNTNNIQAAVQVIVVEEIVILDIVSVHVIDIVLQVDAGTPFDQIPFPDTVEVTLSDDSMITLDVIWSDAGYDPDIPGLVLVEGDLVLVSGIENPDNLKAEIMVEVIGMVYPELIAGWTFSNETLLADVGIPSNIGKPIARDASYTGNYTWPGGATTGSQSLSTIGWADGNGTKYWMIEVSTIGYADLVLSSKQRSSNTGPRDFRVQYRIGLNGAWMDVPDTDITVGNDFTSGVLAEVSLPVAANNKAFLFIRWIMDSNTAVNGTEVISGGTSRIDEIFISGYFSDEFKRIVTSIETPEPLQVDVGTSFEDLPLPETVNVFFDDGGSENLAVDWLEGSYDGDTEGFYTLTGTITIEENMENPDDIMAQIEVIVAPPVQIFTVTFNVDMAGAASFDPAVDDVLISGSMFNFAIPGTIPDEQTLVQTGSTIWSITMELEEGSYIYRYYINAGLANPEPGPDRTILVDAELVLNDIWSATSVNETDLRNVMLFPNPAADHVQIVSDEQISVIKVYNSNGKLILSHSPETREYHLSLETFKPGLYMVRIVSGKKVQTLKMVVEN